MFNVKWVTHSNEIEPIEVEYAVEQNLYDLVSFCLARLPFVRLRYPRTPPDGFLVFDNAGQEVRRWFGSPPLMSKNDNEKPREHLRS